MPEAINFLLNTVLHLAPHEFEDAESVPGSFPCPDFKSDLCRRLRISKKASKSLAPEPPNLISLLSRENDRLDQAKVDLLSTAFDLLVKFADMYKGLEGFIELFQAVLDVLSGLRLEWASDSLKVRSKCFPSDSS